MGSCWVVLAVGLAVLQAYNAAAAPGVAAAVAGPAGFNRQILQEQQSPDDVEVLEGQQEADAEAAAVEIQQGTTCRATLGYVAAAGTSGKLCACAAGSGSYVPTWANESYPVLAPSCQYHDPAKDPSYNSSITFLPAGSGKGQCFCFRCPRGYTSTGGALNSSTAACLPKLPSASLHVRYELTASSGNPCTRAVSTAASTTLRNALKRQLRVADRNLLLVAQSVAEEGTSSAKLPAGTSGCSLTVSLTYYGRDARGKSAATRTLAAAINAPDGECKYGVCTAIKSASKGAATVASAEANTTKTFADVCVPAKCDDRPCQKGVCIAGLCNYTAEEDGADCVDGPVPGTCRVGVCEGLKANIASASQGETEPVIFKARFANLGPKVLLQGLGNDGNSSTNSSQRGAVVSVIGELYDDGKREHDDRYAGDGLYSNTVIIKFEKADVAVYKEFYISQLEKLVSSQIEIAAVTTDYDTLLNVFPTQALVADAQQKLDNLLASGINIAQATQQVYDTLLAQSSSGARSALDKVAAAAASTSQQRRDAETAQFEDLPPLEPINIKAILARIDKASLRQVSERRIEFKTTDGFPCVILAAVDYSQNTTGSSECKKAQSSGGAKRRLLLHTATNDANSAASHQQLLPEVPSTAAAADAAAMHWEPVSSADDSATIQHGLRTLLQATQCETAKGDVLILAPFFAENRCASGDESAEIAALFTAAGYNVKFKCNDPVVCSQGPPSLEDYTGWSQYSFVAVSTIGDADKAGESPLIVARAPTDFSPERMQDWQAGRMVLTGDGLFALRPSWFDKYRNAAPGTPPGRTVVYLAADRTAMNVGTFQDQQARGFPAAMYGMIGSISFAGYDGYLSRKFNLNGGESPGVGIAKHLISGGAVNAYGEDARAIDSVTGAKVRSYTFRASLLFDRCRLVCNGVSCPPLPPCAAKELSCNPLSGTCDTPCCNKADGEQCTLRGKQSTCKGGSCEDRCEAPLCSAPPCQQLVDDSGSPVNKSAAILCDPGTGLCRTSSVPDGSNCVYQGGPGACYNGTCTRVHTINYLLQGPAASFPASSSSNPALSAMQAAVFASLGLSAAYPLSSIQVSVLRPPAFAQTASYAGPAASTAAAQPAARGRAIYKAAIADQPVGSLPPNIGFLLIASPALLVPAVPFGPGLTAQACDENGNILNPIDYCKVRPCGTGAPCEKPECDPITGTCTINLNAEEGKQCVDAFGVGGVCQSGACKPLAIPPPPAPCASSPCDKISGAVKGSCAQIGNSWQYTCSCEQGYQWSGAACTVVDPCLVNNPCASIAHASPTSCTATSPTSWSCSCTFGYIWNQATLTCQDENGCLRNSCNSIQNAVPGSCVDVAAPGVGFNCQCEAGFKWDAATTACVGACVENPCVDTACRKGRCTGIEFCTYTAVNEGQTCELPLSRQSERRAAAMYASTCQNGLCATNLVKCTLSTECGPGYCCCENECVPTQKGDCAFTCANIACQNKGGPLECKCLENCRGNDCSAVDGNICKNQGACCCAKPSAPGATFADVCTAE